MKSTSAMLKAGIVATLIAVSAVSANAQTDVAKRLTERVTVAVQKLDAACGWDIMKYCGFVTPGEGRVIFCLTAHEDHLSPRCDRALYDASRNMDRILTRVERVADYCWADIERHCSNVEAGGGRIAQCLVNKKSSLSGPCRAVLNRAPLTR